MLSQDYLLKCWDTSHCPKTSHSSVGTLRTVPRPLCSSVGTLHTVPRSYVQVLGHLVLSQDLLLKCWDTSRCPKTFRPSVGTLRAVPRLPAQVVGHFVLSQDLPLKCWDTSHCPETLRPSVGTLRAVPRLPAQMLGQSDLFCFETVGSRVLWCWDGRISCSLALGHLDHYPWFHHLSSSIKKNSPKPNLTNQKLYLLAP